MTPQETAPKGWNGMKRRIEKLTKTVNALRTISIQRSGTSDSVSMGQDGITINLREIKIPKTGATQNAELIHAFQLVQVAIDDLCVRQGTIGSVIPTISATELAADVTENSLSLPGTGTREYWLKVTLDANGDITTVTIETTEPGADSATQAKLLLGSVETDSGDIVAFNSNLSGSQALASCGSTHYFGVV
jgi:hypothetical protein